MSNQHGNSDLKRSDSDTETSSINLCTTILIWLSRIIVIITFPISIFLCLHVIPEYKRGVQFRLGRITKRNPRGPGLIFTLPCVDDLYVCDLRTVTYDVIPQEILTRDSVTVRVDAVIYYRIHDPLKAILTVENYMKSTELLSQTTLRNVLGAKSLTEIIGEKDIIAHNMSIILDKATDPWGITVERVEIKDVRLPIMLQRAMATEAESMREARAKIVGAEGEQQASAALKKASDILSESPAALQLRYLQTLASIATERNSTIIFPIPIDLLTTFKK